MHLVRRYEANSSNTMHGIIYCFISMLGIVAKKCYRGGVLSPRNVIDGLQPLESNKYQVEFDLGGRELVSTS